MTLQINIAFDDEEDMERLGDLPEELVEWLHAKCIERDLSAHDALAILGIVTEGLMKGVFKDKDELRRHAAQFVSIFTHVMGLDTVRGARWH